MTTSENHTLTQKIAVVFQKTGPAIYHSHHDLIRFWERAVKRAKLPMRMTQGFNPRPRIIFPHALGLGITSFHEEVELELHKQLNTETILDAVKNAAGDTFGINNIIELPPVKKSRQIVSSSYTISGWENTTKEQLQHAANTITNLPEIIVHRGTQKPQRTLNIKPFIRSITIINQNTLELVLTHTTTGSARPDEIIALVNASLDTKNPVLNITKTNMTLV